MKIQDLRERGLIILECTSGSRAYGLATPESDLDIKGVFILPKEEYFGLKYIAQISNESNDIVFYELGRFMELLLVNNPNILELLASPEGAVRYRHPILSTIRPSLFLSKKCKNSFGKFAFSQIKKARGLNKKISNPMDLTRKSILEFCYVNIQNGSMPINKFLKKKNWNQSDCGLVNIPNMKNVYGLYHNVLSKYGGIVKSEDSTDVQLSSISKNEELVSLLYFNKDGYSTYCKDHREYWDWVNKRNETRFEKTKEHGKNYDAKNMMHTFRLLQMAIEIGESKQINVLRKDREFLLDIKHGKFEYDDLVRRAEALKLEMEEAFENSDLPDEPDFNQINKLTFSLREKFYKEI